MIVKIELPDDSVFVHGVLVRNSEDGCTTSAFSFAPKDDVLFGCPNWSDPRKQEVEQDGGALQI